MGSDITSFTDGKCKTSFNNLDVVNGYPEGVCTPLKITGKLQTFQIAKLDPGCAGESSLLRRDDVANQTSDAVWAQ